MAMPKIPALLLKVLLCGLLLCGCGGQPLSKREIVRAVFFAQQGEHYSVCLLLADQNAPEGESAFKTASAAAPTPGPGTGKRRCDPAGHRLLRSAGRRRPACRG